METEFYIIYTDEEPMTTIGPYPTYDAAVDAHFEHALDEWPEEDSANLRATSNPYEFYLHDDAVRIARIDRTSAV